MFEILVFAIVVMVGSQCQKHGKPAPQPKVSLEQLQQGG